MSIFLIYSSGGHFFQRSRTILCNCGIVHYEEHICEIILNWHQFVRRRWCFKIFLIYISDNRFFVVVFCGMYHYASLVQCIMKLFCEISLNLDQWFRGRCRLKIFLVCNRFTKGCRNWLLNFAYKWPCVCICLRFGVLFYQQCLGLPNISECHLVIWLKLYCILYTATPFLGVYP